MVLGEKRVWQKKQRTQYETYCMMSHKRGEDIHREWFQDSCGVSKGGEKEAYQSAAWAGPRRTGRTCIGGT
jgi:hypothetical protein